MVENLLQHSYLLLQMESYQSSPSCKSVSFSVPLKQSMYIVAIETNKQMLWMKRFLLELSLNQLNYAFKLELIHQFIGKLPENHIISVF